MEKIYFDDFTYAWKTKFNILYDKKDILNECVTAINIIGENEFDVFPLDTLIKSKNTNTHFMDFPKINKIIEDGINLCKELYYENTETKYDKIHTDYWINMVRTEKPKQTDLSSQTEIIMHTHVDINRKLNSFRPNYTYVYYVQMPNNLEGNDGVLYVEGRDGIIYNILPNEDDFIIMESHVPHAPATSKKSTKDRIAIVGNVGFEVFKKNNTLI